MGIKQFFLAAFLTANFSNIITAQQKNSVNDWYSLRIPDDYQNVGKSYPLIVSYRSQATDSLFQHYVKINQSIILQLEDTTNKPLEADSLKLVINKIVHNYASLKDRIYLIGIETNIKKTTEIQEALSYYFAATAYITTNPNTYILLKDTIKKNKHVRLYLFDAIDYNALDSVHNFLLEKYLLGLEVESISEDAVKLNFNQTKDKIDKNQLSLSYGQLNFDNSARSRKESFLKFPKTMGAWQLSYSRKFHKSLWANINLGILIKKIEPPRPDIFSIINGADVDVEGGGIVLLPVSVGMDYFFLKRRFRPYTGVNIGIIPARYKYVEAFGNLSNGINRNEYEFNSKAPFAELSTGFVYRTGSNTQFGLNFDYVKSRNFVDDIGGYKAYGGVKVSLLFSVVF